MSQLYHAGDFFKGGVATESGKQALLLKGEHTLSAGGFLNGFGVDIADVATEVGLDVFGNDHLFHEDGAALVAEGGIVGGDGLVEGDMVKVHTFNAGESGLEVVDGGGVGLIGFFAGGEFTDQALGNQKTDGARENRVGADEVNHTGEGSGGGVGVEGGEHEMTGDGGLDGGAGGVAVANLADHDDVRVKTEDGAETFGEGATSGGVDGDLGDAGDAVFNRILKGDNFAVGGVEGVDDGIEGGGFTGAGGTDHEDEAAGVRDDFLDGGHFAFGETEEIEIQEGFVKVEETEDGVLAVHGGDGFKRGCSRGGRNRPR